MQNHKHLNQLVTTESTTSGCQKSVIQVRNLLKQVVTPKVRRNLAGGVTALKQKKCERGLLEYWIAQHQVRRIFKPHGRQF